MTASTIIPYEKTTRFAPSSERRNVTNTQPVHVKGLFISEAGKPIRVLVEYLRYNGSSSPLGLWTEVVEVVPASEIWPDE